MAAGRLGRVAAETQTLVVADAHGWRDWLDAHHAESPGVWLVLAKRGTAVPTSLTYDEALDEALCVGWIDGQTRTLDDRTYLRRFTPRKPRSVWSKRNVAIIERLAAEGRMRPAGVAEVERARADGRWDAAYEGSKNIEVPDDLTVALRSNPAARAAFERLSRQNRFAILYRIGAAKRPETRTRRIDEFVAMLERGETLYPQRRLTYE